MPNLLGRLARLEEARRERPQFVVHVEHGADADAAIAEHRQRTGYLGPVLVAPVPCATEAEWLERYAPESG